MVEMIIISFVTLLLLFSIVQFSLLYNAKTVLNYAAYEAARVGAVNYSHPQAMRLALAQKLASLEPVQSNNSSAYQSLAIEQEEFINNFDQIACIKRINPPSEALRWSREGLAPNTKMNLPNDHLLYRGSRTKAYDTGEMSIQDANLLKISVTYCPKMIVPIVATAIKRLMLSNSHANDPDPIEGWIIPKLTAFERQCYENNRFPIVAQAIMRMQSPVGKYGYADTDCEDITTLRSQIGN